MSGVKGNSIFNCIEWLNANVKLKKSQVKNFYCCKLLLVFAGCSFVFAAFFCHLFISCCCLLLLPIVCCLLSLIIALCCCLLLFATACCSLVFAATGCLLFFGSTLLLTALFTKLLLTSGCLFLHVAAVCCDSLFFMQAAKRVQFTSKIIIIGKWSGEKLFVYYLSII